jgi:hypothetical protein
MPRISRKQRLEEQRHKNRLFPGPKMKPRPPDFDEELVRKAPTFLKWMALPDGESLTYACRTFVKGHGDDEERLMRRIMIARRNNLKDHAVLKRARALEAERVREEEEEQVQQVETIAAEAANVDFNESSSSLEHHQEQQEPPTYPSSTTNPSGTKKRHVPGKLRPSDHEILSEMDIPAVEATRSYRKWLSLSDGQTMQYNQEYVKGEPEQDWLLRKNIWRRMRYRRENLQKIRVMQQHHQQEQENQVEEGNDGIIKENDDNDSLELMDEEGTTTLQEVQSVVDAAVAAAAAAHVESYATSFDAVAVAALDYVGVGGNDGSGDADGGGETIMSALDAAAQLAASVLNPVGVGLNDEEEEEDGGDVHEV